VTETVARFRRVRVERRDGEDPLVSAARHDRRRKETADIAALMTDAHGFVVPDRWRGRLGSWMSQ
jgi:hypothetical protein